ncbi:MAG: O-antigen ligase family protein [Cellulomonas sp.]
MTQPNQPALHLSPKTDGPWVALLTLPVLALVVPSALIFSGPLQSNGWPARLLTFWIAAAIVLGWVSRRRRLPRVSPAEVACWILLAASVCAYAAGGMRALVDAEVAGQTREALVLFPLLIVAIGVATLADVRRCDQLLVGVLIGATISAAFAVAQSVAAFDVAHLLQLPGMVARNIGGMGIRGSFIRVKGASAHPIELGVICGSVIPVAIHFARFAATRRHRMYAGLASLVLFLAIPLSVSRSGVLVVAISMAVYAIVLTTRQRLEALVLALVGLVLLRAAIPGLLGAVRSIFGGAANDPSITGRTQDYAALSTFISQSPIFGHGLGTFRPEEYFFLDNQYLLGMVEGGVVFVIAMIVFFGAVVASARGAVLRATTPEAASRAQAIASGVTAIAISALFFDLFSFAQITLVLFLFAGIAGALWHAGVNDGLALPTPRERILGASVRVGH